MFGWVDAFHRVLNISRVPVFRHFPYIETDLLRTVDAGQHAGAHARIVVVRRRAYQGDAMTSAREFVEIEESFYMGMTSADKHEMSSRFRVLHYLFTANVFPGSLMFCEGFEDSRVQAA